MRVHQDLDDCARTKGVRRVVTLGVFDGVHVGHRHVLRECRTLATERGCRATVLTFATHPRAVIEHCAPRLITSMRHRLRLFDELGVDEVVALTFGEALRSMSAADFAHGVFEDALGAEIVVLGHNGRFGLNREGCAEWLIERRDQFRFEARRAAEVRLGRDVVSSTVIRAAIEAGELERASSMLGRPYSLLGIVVEGDRRGRDLGFPTANLDLEGELLPPRGVWGGVARAAFGERPCIVNIGVRPTFGGGDRAVLEAHLLDFSGDLYGQELEIVFQVRFRDERRFAGAAELVQQIESDRATLRSWLATGSLPSIPDGRD